MREITSHKVNGLNEAINIEVIDPPVGGANHAYVITVPRPNDKCRQILIDFQIGPIAEVGVNGISNESLLAVVEDRLKGFQSGPYSCRENAIALTHIQDAMHWLHHRTRERMARGVEGTTQK